MINKCVNTLQLVFLFTPRLTGHRTLHSSSLCILALVYYQEVIYSMFTIYLYKYKAIEPDYIKFDYSSIPIASF